MSKILLYCQSGCKASDKLKQTLSSNKISFIEKDITNDVLLKREMIERSGGRATTPKLFLNGELINESSENIQGFIDSLKNKKSA